MTHQSIMMTSGSDLSSLCVDFTMHLQASVFTDRNSFPCSPDMLPELCPLRLHCPSAWVGGYLALWISKMGKKICVNALHTEQAK